MADDKKNIYLNIHKNFVKTDIEYKDPKTGEMKTFNSVTLPKNTVIDGKDVSYYQFSPLFVNESKIFGENYRTIPLLPEREVWLKRSVLDEHGEPILDDKGHAQKDVVKVLPEQLKEALDQNRKDYKESLDSRADHAREGADALGKSDDRQRAEAQVR